MSQLLVHFSDWGQNSVLTRGQFYLTINITGLSLRKTPPPLRDGVFFRWRIAGAILALKHGVGYGIVGVERYARWMVRSGENGVM